MTTSSPRSKYIDSSGNEIDTATYESLLAQHILEHPEFWKDVFDKFNKKLLELIEYNKNNEYFMYRLKDSLSILQRTFPEIKDVNHFIKEFSELKEVKSAYPNRLNFNSYKMFVESIIPSAWILPDSPLLQKEEAKKEKTSEEEEKLTYRDILSDNPQLRGAHWRPEELFTYYARGREQVKFRYLDTLIESPGLTSEVAAHPKYKDKLKGNPSFAAKVAYARMKDSPTVAELELHGIPFGSGPSGTIGFLIPAFFFLMSNELLPEDYKKILMAVTAHLVYEGHHAFAEVGMILNALKEIDPIAFPVDPTLKKKEYYDQYLTDTYRVSDAYHQFYTEHHLSKYSAMTWQILRDAVFESKDITTSSSVINQLQEFTRKYKDKFGELEPQELEQLKGILDTKEENPIIKKLIKKLEDSGIQMRKEQQTESKMAGSSAINIFKDKDVEGKKSVDLEDEKLKTGKNQQP